MTDDNQNPQNQTQSQIQHNSLMVTVQNSSDPGLEREIFKNVASAGRQLGRIADVLDILIVAYEGNPYVVHDANSFAAINAFRNMRAEIAKQVDARSPDRFIEALDALSVENGKAYTALLPRLQQWLDEHRNDVALAQQSIGSTGFQPISES
jgi:hypothetical protein